MPRRKQAFINKAKARTYQLVHRSSGDAGGDEPPLLVAVGAATGGPAQDNPEEVDIDNYLISAQVPEEHAPLHSSYKAKDYELGEYGFPDDGYDYSKHFRTIGGGGGVFMDAVTGMPADAHEVKSDKETAASRAAVAKDEVVLRAEAKPAEEEHGSDDWRRKEDVVQYQLALEEIKRERRRNKDLDEVFAALDSDGDFDTSGGEEEEDDDINDLDELGGEDNENDVEDLEDDFIAVADQANEFVGDLDGGRGPKRGGQLDGVIEQFRKPRLLDEQFDKFMKGYEFPDSESDEGGFPSEQLGDVDDIADFQAHMTNEELEDMFDADGLLEDLSGLKIATEEGDVVVNPPLPPPDAATEELAQELAANSIGGTDGMTDRAVEYAEFANAEFERGMNGLLESYNRVTAEEALGAIDGVEVALEAVARGEEEEAAKIQKRLDCGLDEESDGHDSELDSKFDEMFRDPEEKWDCETILSTYTNLENHPSVIDAPSGRKRRSVQSQPIIRLDPRTQAPVDYMPMAGSSQAKGAADYGSRRDVAEEAHSRSRNESKEEKKARKAAVKEAARERRALKSEMKKAFGSEQVKQSRHSTSMGTSKVAIQF